MTRKEQIEAAAEQYDDVMRYAEIVEGRKLPTIEEAFRDGAQWADVIKPSPWISVERRLPEMYQDCLVINKGRILVARRRASATRKEPDAWCWSNCLLNVTHWMPLPKIPRDL